jgi:hypothetical protein
MMSLTYVVAWPSDTVCDSVVAVACAAGSATALQLVQHVSVASALRKQPCLTRHNAAPSTQSIK